ncbi:MAG: succinate dehydrogenase, hydrophobic membrane anchor protein [Pseudomonadota bacterium]|nr:succinate dehydrogenase, hydrophobic membrane anchor protein [Pseudomonadota bacterium]
MSQNDFSAGYKETERNGSGHWWAQKLSAIALIPLTVWFLIALLGINSFSHKNIFLWISLPLNSALLIFLLFTALYHSFLGLKVIIEDYVHGSLNNSLILGLKIIHFLLGAAAILALVKIIFSNGNLA